MVEGKKLASIIIPVSLLLTLLRFIRGDQQSAEPESHGIIKSEIRHNKPSPDLVFQIKFHGFILWASMGLLMPVGILVIRMSNSEKCGKKLRIMFYTHATIQILALFLATTGAILSIRHFENSFTNTHQRVGLALYGAIWLQALTGFFRPRRGGNGRSVWFLVHWSMGTMISLLGILNVYTGLQAYHKRCWKPATLWTTIFTVEVSLLAFFYLFQDKWNYIIKQGVLSGDEPIRPTDQDLSPREKKNKKNGFFTYATP